MKFIAILLLVSVFGVLSYAPEHKKHHRRPVGRISNMHRYSNYTLEAKSHVFHHSTRYRVIVAPSLPVRYNEINYYWYGHYVRDGDHPQKCEYHIDETDKEFENVSFSDGSKPQSLQFGCLSYQDCCGLECCGDSRSSTVVVCVIFVVGVLGYKAYKKYAKYSRERKGSTTMTISAINDPTMEIHAV
uniref:CX domain-containing protein n=1 Tax=Caenorhabditis tropicalis TaxID=1561998 RepID=A0A1I7UKF4_9PELO